MKLSIADERHIIERSLVQAPYAVIVITSAFNSGNLQCNHYHARMKHMHCPSGRRRMEGNLAVQVRNYGLYGRFSLPLDTMLLQSLQYRT